MLREEKTRSAKAMQPAYIARVQKVRSDSGAFIFRVRSLVRVRPRPDDKRVVSRRRKSATAQHMEVCPPADRKHRLPFEILAAEDTAITIAKDTTAGLQSPGSGDIALDACALAAYADETVAFNFPNTSVVQSPPLHFPASDITVATATPPKRRRGKCMSRRRGQNGQIVISGNWYRVRFWIDVPGQERRLHRSERI
jgi:hypothetical protein